ncbi:MAG: FAD:protein FMN transferase [Bacteroidales bacterium]|nr:FAD:protein FMN transferase [Bacteroidales bacterium]
MGTRFNLLLPGIDIPDGDNLFSSCIKVLNRIEKMLSCFLPTSDISFINEHAYHHPVEVNSELLGILKDCLNYFKLTQGCFDISLGKIIDFWNGKQNEVDVDSLTKNTGADKIKLDFQNKTVRFTTPHIKLNLGGFGKGYALQKIQGLLTKLGITSAFISFGESSVSCLGKHPHGDCWPVGVQDFYQKDKSLATLKLVNQSVSTSGNMEESNHIIHPRKGKPIEEIKMISVKSDSATDAEVLSTSLMVANDQQWEKIQKSFPGAEVLKVKYINEKAEITKK